MNGEEKQEVRQSKHERQIQNRNQHPPSHYSINEVYEIRKESLYNSNDLIFRKLGRSFQRIKKMKANNQQRQVNAQYDLENSKIRQSFRRIKELYNRSSQTHLITKQKMQKMKRRVEKVKSEVYKDEQHLSRQVDIMRLYMKNHSVKNGLNEKKA